MKTLIAIAIFSLGVIQTIQAQTGSSDKRNTYQAWINTYDASRPGTGVLYEVQDSSITLSNRIFSRNGSPGKVDMTKLDVRSIDVIRIRRNGNISQGILYGAISGLVVGGTLGLLYALSVEKHEEGANNLEKSFNSAASSMAIAGTAILIGIGCIGTGIGVGAIIGSAKITIPIKGSQEQFNLNKPMLYDYSAKNIAGQERKTFSKLSVILADIDGNVYSTLALGGQVWMAEDLKTSHYRDGSEIKNVTKNDRGGECMYSWLAVGDSSKLCPNDWHVPSLAEWTSLYNSLGGEIYAAENLEEKFSGRDQVYQWWSSTVMDADHAQSFYLDNKTVGVIFTSATKSSGLSVRCIRDN
jgi:hypothetical protein